MLPTLPKLQVGHKLMDQKKKVTWVQLALSFF